MGLQNPGPVDTAVITVYGQLHSMGLLNPGIVDTAVIQCMDNFTA